MKLLISLDHGSTKPIYRQIFEEFRSAIDQGVLKQNEKLPSTRDLAEDLGISRFTVMRSYEDLASCGYIKIATGSGAYVLKGEKVSDNTLADFSPPQSIYEKNDQRERATAWSRRRAKPALHATFDESTAALDFSLAVSDMLPEARWKQALYKAIQNGTTKLPQFGSLRLREALSTYLRTSRRVTCRSSQIVVFDSFQSALDFLVDMLVGADDLCLVEAPSAPAFVHTIEERNGRVAALNIDGLLNGNFDLENYTTAEIIALTRLVLVSPQHNPITGKSLSDGDKEKLLELLYRSQAYMIENDVDHEYHYSARRAPALTGFDLSKRTIYLGTAARVLGGLTTMAYVVLPESLLEEAERKLTVNGMNVSSLEQEALALMISEGHFERHIKRTFHNLATRRAAAIHALTVRFGRQVKIQASAYGTSLSLLFDRTYSLSQLSLAAEQAGLPMLYTGTRHQSPAQANEFLLAFGNLGEKALEEKIAHMQSLLTTAQPTESHEVKALEFALTSALY